MRRFTMSGRSPHTGVPSISGLAGNMRDVVCERRKAAKTRERVKIMVRWAAREYGDRNGGFDGSFYDLGSLTSRPPINSSYRHFLNPVTPHILNNVSKNVPARIYEYEETAGSHETETGTNILNTGGNN